MLRGIILAYTSRYVVRSTGIYSVERYAMRERLFYGRYAVIRGGGVEGVISCCD